MTALRDAVSCGCKHDGESPLWHSLGGACDCDVWRPGLASFIGGGARSTASRSRIATTIDSTTEEMERIDRVEAALSAIAAATAAIRELGAEDALCEKMDAPATADWSADGCEEAMLGSAETCGHPCLRSVSIDDFEEWIDDSTWDYEDFFKVGTEPDDPEAMDLLKVAWRVILDSQDLMRWAHCWVKGDRFAAECEVNTFTNEGGFWGALDPRVKIDFDSSCSFNYRGFAWLPGSFNVWGGTIRICTDTGTTCDSELSVWKGGATTQDRACAAVDVATALNHEMTHVCGEENDPDDRGSCHEADLIETAYQWAVLKRYSIVRDSSCCGQMYDTVTREPLSIIFASTAGFSVDFGCL